MLFPRWNRILSGFAVCSFVARSFAARGLPLLAVVFALTAEPTRAQWPGQVAGQVLDARTGRAIPSVDLTIDGVGGRLQTDGSGSFRSRGLEPGRYRIVARHFAYLEGVVEVDVRNGEVARVLLELVPSVLALDTLRAAVAESPSEPGLVRIERVRIARMGARTAGDAVLALPGVRLNERVPGGAQTVSIRGSGADQVLVLVDGVPLNDPISGEADLSSISAASIEDITLVSGARSARFGPRAQGGAIVIRTGNATARREAAASVGSLGERGGLLGAGGGSRRFRWGVGAEGRELRGDFRFVNPASATPEGEPPPAPRDDRRENADMRQLFLRATAEGSTAGGDWNARLGYEALDRGNPGRSFAPSRSARQRLRRGRASLSWRRESVGAESARGSRSGSEELSLYSTVQQSTAFDQDPPFGTPYDDQTRLHSFGGVFGFSRNAASRWWSAFGGGAEIGRQAVRSDVLENPEGEGGDGSGSVARVDFGIFLRGRVRLRPTENAPELSLVARAHRDGSGKAWYPGHEATLSIPAGGFALHLAHRSSFSPPTLGDQYFRDGVGVVPNPDLRAERVPSEWEAGLSRTFTGDRATFSVGAEIYRGDVRDMIIWAPDFRFIWSPRNVDVERSGLEARGELRLPTRGLHFSGSYSLARTTYGRSGQHSGGTNGVQLAYRPRHAASIAAGWEGTPWHAEITGRYTGLRYPVPAAVNAMDPFWSFGASLSRSWSWSGWKVRPLVRVDRLLAQRDSHIFGFPEPGRTFVVELRAMQER